MKRSFIFLVGAMILSLLFIVCQTVLAQPGLQNADETGGPAYPASSLELAYFDVQIYNGDVHLNWASGMNWEFSNYSIQRSSYMQTWHEIGKVEVNPNAVSDVRLTYIDQDLRGGMRYYYRFAHFNSSKEVKVSEVESIYMPDEIIESNISIYPNPVKRSGILNVKGMSSEGSIRIISINGQESHSITIGKDGPIELSKINLTAGLYIVEITDDLNRTVTQMVVLE